MTTNEISQEVLALLHKGGASIASHIAHDLYLIEKNEKARLNRALSMLKDEGLIVSDKIDIVGGRGMVNQYSVTPEGIDAIEASAMDLEDPEPVKLPPKALPDHAVLKADRIERERLEAAIIPADQSINPADQVFGQAEPELFCKEAFQKLIDSNKEQLKKFVKEPKKPNSITKFMLIVEGESFYYASKEEAQQEAKSYVETMGESVEYFELSGHLVGEYKPVFNVEFIGADSLTTQSEVA